MNRARESIIPLEAKILRIAASRGHSVVYGYELVTALKESSDISPTHGAIYKACHRLERRNLLTSRWDQVQINGRPQRRVYEITEQGRSVVGERPT